MKIQELLSDDELYELTLMMTEIIWQSLMAHSISDVNEAYRPSHHRSFRPVRRPVNSAVTQRPRVPVKPFPKPKPLYPERTQVSQTQRLKTNPKIDPLKGYNARLDNTNVFPEITDAEKEIERKRNR